MLAIQGFFFFDDDDDDIGLIVTKTPKKKSHPWVKQKSTARKVQPYAAIMGLCSAILRSTSCSQQPQTGNALDINTYTCMCVYIYIYKLLRYNSKKCLLLFSDQKALWNRSFLPTYFRTFDLHWRTSLPRPRNPINYYTMWDVQDKCHLLITVEKGIAHSSRSSVCNSSGIKPSHETSTVFTSKRREQTAPCVPIREKEF